jgi:hypothetical protein
MIPNSTQEWDALLASAAWRDLERIVEERIIFAMEQLSTLGNTQERDIELKSRIAEMRLLISLPKASRELIHTYKLMKENDARDDDQLNAERVRRSKFAGDETSNDGSTDDAISAAQASDGAGKTSW